MKGLARAAMVARLHALALAACLWIVPSGSADAAWQVEWELMRPTNSGIPGELVESLAWAPNGNLWVAAQHPVWGEGGVGIFDLDTEIWTGFYNWQSPLPSQYVGDMRFDGTGAAWMGTSAGLVRYDGVSWQIFDSSNSPLQLGPVQDVEIAPDGTIWLNNSSHAGGGDAIYAFDGVDQWTSYGVPAELPWPDPWQDLADLFVDSDGHVWVTNDVLPGLAEFDGASWTLHTDPNIIAMFESIAEDAAGNLWMIGNQVTGDDMYYRFDGDLFIEYPFETPTRMVVDPEDGALYCSNWHGTILRSTDNGASWNTWLSGLNIVLDIAPQPGTSDIWVATAGAVGHFTYDGQLVRDYNTWNTGIGDFWIDRMSEDRSGYFWLAAGESGLSRFDGVRWRNWGAHNAGSEPYPFEGNDAMGTAYEDTDGDHWFGGNGIARWDSETGDFTGFWNRDTDVDLAISFIWYFAQDMHGGLFAVNKHGVTLKFDGTQWDREPIAVYAVSGCPGAQADSDGNVWVSGWFDIHKWDGTSWSMVTLPDPDFFFDLGGINRMIIDTNDVMWLATMQGLVRWDGVDFTIYDTSNTPVPALAIRGLDVRDDGLIGISAHDNDESSSGIALVDAATIEDPTTWLVFDYGVSPQPHWQIEDCTFDPWGDLWVSALSMGVAILHIDQLVATGEPGETPGAQALLAARPNPARASTTISFHVPTEAAASVSIHDVRGRTVRNLLDEARVAEGPRSVVWDGRDDGGRIMPSGVYFVRLHAGKHREVRKLTLLR